MSDYGQHISPCITIKLLQHILIVLHGICAPFFHPIIYFKPRCLSFPSVRPTGPCRPHPPRLSVCRGTVAPHSSWLRPAGSEGPDPSSDNNTLLFGRREVYTYVDSHELELLVSLCMVVWHQWNNIVIQSSTSFNTEIHNLLHRQSRSSEQFWNSKVDHSYLTYCSTICWCQWIQCWFC